jgi:hypothetical protein
VSSEEKRKERKCFYCGESIFFDDNSRTPNGYFVPLDFETGERHHCKQYRRKKVFGEKKSGSGIDIVEDSEEDSAVIEQRPLDYRD